MSTKCKGHEDFYCLDCDICTHCINEYYMVTDTTWLKAHNSKNGMLCIGCLEQRLQRKLEIEDFTLFPINYGKIFTQSERLKQRLYGALED